MSDFVKIVFIINSEGISQLAKLFSSQEASRIRTEAENTKKRAVDLKDNADLLADDVADTDDQIVNLNVQAESDSELATEV